MEAATIITKVPYRVEETKIPISRGNQSLILQKQSAKIVNLNDKNSILPKQLSFI